VVVPSGLELHLFSSGTLVYAGFEVPVPFFLLRHPLGDVVVDGGNPLAVAQDPQGHLGPLADIFEVHMTEQDHCVAQLQRLGVRAASIGYIVQTHLHMDHTGALGHFPNASVIVHERELEAALASQSPVETGYVREDFDRTGIDWRPVTGEHDVFGDGAIRLIETPGHSAGHMSILLSLEQTGPVLLTADAADNRAQWQGRMEPRAMASREDAARSIELLRRLAAEHEALVVFGHDPKNWASVSERLSYR
jgi:glyoxylase-like metal-dependent hydrolase (beta-lactamase superfamily II)